jgi:hypothetical protein
MQAPGVHTYNPTRSGGRDQEDQSRFTKIGLVEWLKVKALRSNSSTAKKKKKSLYYGSPLASYILQALTNVQGCVRMIINGIIHNSTFLIWFFVFAVQGLNSEPHAC